jgi:hypothetical protein
METALGLLVIAVIGVVAWKVLRRGKRAGRDPGDEETDPRRRQP